MNYIQEYLKDRISPRCLPNLRKAIADLPEECFSCKNPELLRIVAVGYIPGSKTDLTLLAPLHGASLEIKIQGEDLTNGFSYSTSSGMYKMKTRLRFQIKNHIYEFLPEMTSNHHKISKL
jgi:hypothetical protein